MGKNQFTNLPNFRSEEGSALLGDHEEQQTAEESTPTNYARKHTTLIGLVMFCAALMGITATRFRGSSRHASLAFPSLTAGTVRPCTFKECYAAQCNKTKEPFTCITNNGGPHGGCATVEWVKGTCDDQCNLSECSKIAIPKNTENCKGKKCGASWCESGQVCGMDLPYQCKSGSGRFGCNEDALHWTLAVGDQVCSECCDVNTC